MMKTHSLGLFGNGVITNQGTISASGAGTKFISGDLFDNQGTVEVAGTTLRVTGNNSWSNTGTYRVNDAAGTLEFHSTLTTAGLGFVDNVAGGTVLLAGTIDNTLSTLTLDATTGDYTMRGGTITGGTVTQSGGNLQFSSPSSGIRNVLDGVTVNGDVLMSGGVANLILRNGTDLQNDALLTANGTTLVVDTAITLNNTIDLTGSSSTLGAVSNGALTLSSTAQVNLTGSTAQIRTDAIPGLFGNGVITNQGTISASGAGTKFISGDLFDNQGTVEVAGTTLRVSPTTLVNLSGTTLTGGVWRSVGGSRLELRTGNVTENGAEIIIDGVGSEFTVTTSNTALEDTLESNSSDGILRILGGRDFVSTPVASFANAGIVELGGGMFDAPMLDNQVGSELFGFGAVTPAVANGGLVRATGGTLVLTGGVQGSAGAVQIDVSGGLDLSTAAVGSDANTLLHNGSAAGSLNLGANDFTVSSDYDNGNFGVGNSFDPRANVAGGGQILADGDVSQTLTGDVTDGNTTTATLEFNNVHVGDVVSKNYQVSNAGTTGPVLRGAIQTAAGSGNITDSQLSGTGVTPGNFGPIATGTDSGDLTVTYTATTPGFITAGQVVNIDNNFDNVDGQTLSITGTAYRFANPTLVSPNPIVFANSHVGDVFEQILTLTNDVPDDGFSEALNASLSGATGSATQSGSINQLAPQASDSSSLSVGIDTQFSGTRTGAVTLNLASDGAGSSGLGVTSLAPQTINVSGNVYNFANASTVGPVSLPNVHVGDLSQQAISIKNDIIDNGFSESLNVQFTAMTGDAFGTGSINLLAPQQTDSTSLFVGVDTTTAGSKSGNVSRQHESDGTGTSGLGVTLQGTPFTAVTGDVYRLAEMVNSSFSPTLPDIALGNVHVGDIAESSVSIRNGAANDGFSENLSVSIGSTDPNITARGSINQFPPNTLNNNQIFIGIDTSAAGNFSGAVTLDAESDGTGVSDLGTTALPSQMFEVSGSVFRLAEPTIQNTQPIDFGIVHVGEVVAPVGIAVANNAAVDGFSENLDASFSGSTTGILASGTLENLAAGGSDNSSLSVSIDTGTAGVRDGTATIALVSDGDGVNTLGQMSLGTVDLQVTGTVNEFANAELSKVSGAGSFEETASNEFTIDFGVIDLNAGDVVADFELQNDVVAPADTLAGTWTLDASDFSLSGFDPFSEIAAGASLSDLQIGLSSTIAGAFSGSLVLSPLSENTGGFSGALAPITVLVQGIVSAPADFNEDGSVDELDLSQWEGDYGLGAGSDADGDLDSDGADFLAWQRGLGAGFTSLVASKGVPEPTAVVLLLIASLQLTFRRVR